MDLPLPDSETKPLNDELRAVGRVRGTLDGKRALVQGQKRDPLGGGRSTRYVVQHLCFEQIVDRPKLGEGGVDCGGRGGSGEGGDGSVGGGEEGKVEVGVGVNTLSDECEDAVCL